MDESKMSAIFVNVDDYFKSLRSLHQLAYILMPAEISSPKIKPPKVTMTEDLSVYDMLNNGIYSQDAWLLSFIFTDVANLQTMASYIHFKLGAIIVDAIEAIAQGHVSRARLLDTER